MIYLRILGLLPIGQPSCGDEEDAGFHGSNAIGPEPSCGALKGDDELARRHEVL